MSGHSKWATIKRKKGAADAKRGKLFARLIRSIEVAAKEGGSDLDGNPTLADAVEKARDNSVPKETIDRAVKRGAGELSDVAYDPVQYEGYAPGGVAVLVDCLTDNRNRAAADVRSIFTKSGGSLANPGSVAYLFSRRGQVIVPLDGVTEDDVLSVGLDAGLEDVEVQSDQIVAWCDPTDVRDLRAALEKSGLPVREAGMPLVPATTVAVTEPDVAKRVLRLLDALDDNDDVQDVWSNLDIPDELMEQLYAE